MTEKPWARELAEELGLGAEILPSRDEDKKTYLWLDGQLVALPDRMRMMIPEDLSTLDSSPLFSAEAKAAYARELTRADELRASAPGGDESVASFVRRHFGEEVLTKIAAPLLSGIFGGDVARLSVRAVMAPFVKMEAEHGSLIAALQAQRRERGDRPRQATFTTLRRGMGSLTDAIVGALPPECLHLRTPIHALDREADRRWRLRGPTLEGPRAKNAGAAFDRVLIALPVDAARHLLAPLDSEAAALIPADASSAVLATFCWPASAAVPDLPPGFGFLVPQAAPPPAPEPAPATGNRDPEQGSRRPRLLAGTFTDQKFSGRAPTGARIVRVFFGGIAAQQLNAESDGDIAAKALQELGLVLPELPAPDAALTAVHRWPRSLPQYEVGHQERMAALEERVKALETVLLLGNGYHGVGVPDLIRAARTAARGLG